MNGRPWTKESGCMLSLAKLPAIVPETRLPPSLGMKLIRTPPVAAVASTAAVSMANSDVPDAFGGKYPTTVIPSTVVLDREHRVAAVFLRELLAEDLQPVVQRLAAEPAPAT